MSVVFEQPHILPELFNIAGVKTYYAMLSPHARPWAVSHYDHKFLTYSMVNALEF